MKSYNYEIKSLTTVYASEIANKVSSAIYWDVFDIAIRQHRTTNIADAIKETVLAKEA